MSDSLPFEDLDEFLNVSEFARSVTVDGAPVVLQIEKEYTDEGDYSGRIVTAWGKDSDLSSVTQASTVVDGTTTYRVAEIQPDGTGATTLVLERQ